MQFKNWAIALFSVTTAVVMSISATFAQTAEVLVDGLNVRSGPGPGYTIRGTIPKGTQAKIIQSQGKWYYIVMGRIEGWVYEPYVRVLSGNPGSKPGSNPSELTIALCQGNRRNTARVYRSNGQLNLRMYDRQQSAVWLNAPVRSETNPEVNIYSNIYGERTIKVSVNRNDPTSCSIQIGNQLLEPGTNKL